MTAGPEVQKRVWCNECGDPSLFRPATDTSAPPPSHSKPRLISSTHVTKRKKISMPMILMFLLSLVSYSPVMGDDGPDYAKEIKPLLQRRCFSCHGALKQRGNLRLDVRSTMIQGGDNGSAVVPHKPEESILIDAISARNGLRRMPLEGEPLKPEEIELLTRWIATGAVAPDEPLPANPREHWAFKKPLKSIPPNVNEPEWNTNPIDRFVFAELKKRGLQPISLAEKNLLLRRVSLDLLGLPPTRQQLQEFLNDTAPDAYEKLVDRMLTSPQYGERWGRHWMDVWRYSDWDGYGSEIRESQAHIWRWRDWIVESLNADKPYHQMVEEMLAADELYPQGQETIRATGFLARNYFKFNRNVWLDNTIEHTFKAFQGITMNCARCHDHMYDPISQVEYYQARAIFEPYDVRTDRIPSQSDTSKDGLVRAYDANLASQTFLLVRGDEKQPRKDQSLSPAIPSVLGGGAIQSAAITLPAVAYYPGLNSYSQNEFRRAAEQKLKDAEDSKSKAHAVLLTAQQKLSQFQASATNEKSFKPAEAILEDNFNNARPELWKQLSGQWEYATGKLLQKQVGATFCGLESLVSLPRDFVVKFRFKTTGGEMWKSVGITFDARADAEGTGVYLSAFAGGPKVQAALTTQGQTSYPADALKPFPTTVGEEHELIVFVKDQLMNVGVDGKALFVYRSPKTRISDGQFRLWTFDASAEFLGISVHPLTSETNLLERIDADSSLPAIKPLTVEAFKAAVNEAELVTALAEKKLAIAQAEHVAINARIDADNANYLLPKPTLASELSKTAVKAEREVSLAQAELVHLQAMQMLEKLRFTAGTTADEKQKKELTDLQAKLDQASKAVEIAKTALGQPPTENYTRFGPVYSTTSSGRRTALAKWLSSRENPLTARVAINHIWARHFGMPLVSTMFDFGVNGKTPSHPELLDFLAVELMDNEWRMKAIHRLIVTSHVYRLGSNVLSPDDPNLQIDPENVYLWKAHVHRMEAEIVRDSTFSACEQLDLTQGGPDLDPNLGQTVPRRSLYFRSAKEKKVQFLAMFDSANPVECYRRSESIVPQQALAMANSTLTLAQARLLAQRLSREAGEGSDLNSHSQFIRLCMLQILNREPSDEERQECLNFLESQTKRFADKSRLTSSGGAISTHVAPSAIPHLRARENLVHVLLNHNDFITIR